MNVHRKDMWISAGKTLTNSVFCCGTIVWASPDHTRRVLVSVDSGLPPKRGRMCRLGLARCGDVPTTRCFDCRSGNTLTLLETHASRTNSVSLGRTLDFLLRFDGVRIVSNGSFWPGPAGHQEHERTTAFRESCRSRSTLPRKHL